MNIGKYHFEYKKTAHFLLNIIIIIIYYKNDINSVLKYYKF